MEYVEVKDGFIITHMCSEVIPIGKQFREVSELFIGAIGNPIIWFDWNKKGERFPDELLIRRGDIQDKRGIYYNKKTKLPEEIYDLDIIPSNDVTNIKPDQNEEFQEWDEESQKWKVNEIKKHKYILNNEIAYRNTFLNKSDYKVIKIMEQMVKDRLEISYPGILTQREQWRLELKEFQNELDSL